MKIDPELLDYQRNKNSTGLILKYHPIIEKLTNLCKGTHRDPDAMFRWFYGLFLDGQQKNIMNLLEVRDDVINATSSLSREECYHHILIFFLDLSRKYKVRKNRKNNRYYRYIRMVLGWKVKNWIDTLLSRATVPLHAGLFSLYEDYIEDEDIIQPFTLDLAWVMSGSNNPLFKELRAYERYILYLYFVENYSIARLAIATYQAKNTVNADLNKTLEKCRVALLRE